MSPRGSRSCGRCNDRQGRSRPRTLGPPVMENPNRILAIAAVVVTLVVAAIMLQPVVRRELAPVLETAWVAIDTGSGEAIVGPVVIASGTPFTLHAVIEAKDRSGQPIFYTEAPRLRFPDREVAAASLRRWDRPEIAKV